MTTALISREDLLPYANVAEDDDKWDTLLEALVLAATEVIEDYCGTEFTLEESEEFFESYESLASETEPQFLWLRKAPISEDCPVQVFYDPTRQFTTALAENRTFVNRERGLVQVYTNAGDRKSVV